MTYLPFPAVLPVDITNSITSATRDAFGRIRTSTPTTLFDAKQLYDGLPLHFSDVQVSGTAGSTYNTNQASTSLTVNNLTAGLRVRQTKRRFSYQPGKSQLIDATYCFNAGVSGVTKRVGYFDTNNGLFIQQLGATVSLGLRSFVSGVAVTTLYNQNTWNIDRMDGSGGLTNPSGITMDVTKSQIITFVFQWLGVGGITYCFNINNIIYPIHHVNNANLISTVFMSTPNLPVRFEIENDGTGGSSSLTTMCCSVASEGGRLRLGIDKSVDRGTTSLVTLANTNLFPLIAIRIASGREAAQVVPKGGSIICTSTGAFLWRMILNPTVTGTAFSYSAITNSYVEAATATTNATTVSGGTVVFSGYSQAQNEGTLQIRDVPDISLGFTVGGVSDVLVLAVATVGGTAEAFYGSMSFHEDL